MVFPQIKGAPRNKGNSKKHEHHHRNCNKSCTFVMFLHGVSYQSFFPFQVLNFYFDMVRTKEEGAILHKRHWAGWDYLNGRNISSISTKEDNQLTDNYYSRKYCIS